MAVVSGSPLLLQQLLLLMLLLLLVLLLADATAVAGPVTATAAIVVAGVQRARVSALQQKQQQGFSHCGTTGLSRPGGNDGVGVGVSVFCWRCRSLGALLL